MTYKIRPCSYCEQTFQPITSGNKHCSPECRFLSIMVPFNGLPGCWTWPMSYFKSGYGQFAINTRTPETAHRMAYKTLRGEVDHGFYVCHSCDNRACFNPSHLFIGTPTDNARDMWEKGRQQDYTKQPKGTEHPLRKDPSKAARGERVGTSIYTAEQIAQILASNLPATELAKQLGVNRNLIYKVRAGLTWKWIKDATIATQAAK